MKEFNPYITFDGNCEEALRFYEIVFEGMIEFIQYEKDTPGLEPTSNLRVLHSEFRAGNIHFMACDRHTDQSVHIGTNVSLYVNFENEKIMESTFARLSEAGKIIAPINNTHFGSRIGIITDKFDIHWMLLYNPK